jgi:molybdopterin molybdotransferase
VADLAVLPARLRILERIFAGDRPRHTVVPGTCARIMTGAPLPNGADAVVMQEKARADGDFVEILEAARLRANVRDAGEDARAGALLLPEGTALGLAEVGLLWAQGLSHAPVRRKPRVSILSSGDELVPVGAAQGDRIVDTNSPTLALAVARAGGLPTCLGIAEDRLESVEALVEKGRGADVLITSAGASVGEKDFVREALQARGVELDFWKVAIKPGKPLAVGTWGDTLVFGLPGNPVSSMVTFELFVRPALRAMLGHRQVLPSPLPGRCAVALKKPKGVRQLVRVVLDSRERALWATPLPSQTSGALASAVSAAWLMSLAPELEQISVGQEVDLIPTSWGP